MITILKLIGSAGIACWIIPKNQPFARRIDAMLFSCTLVLIGILLIQHPVLVGLSTLLTWIGLAIVLQGLDPGIRKWAIVLWLLYGLLGLISLSIGSEMWVIALMGTGVGVGLLRGASWIRRTGRKSYAMTVQFKKIKVVDDIFALAKRYQFIIIDHGIQQGRNYELTLRYESDPIRHHLFLRALAILPAIKRFTTRG